MYATGLKPNDMNKAQVGISSVGLGQFQMCGVRNQD